MTQEQKNQLDIYSAKLIGIIGELSIQLERVRRITNTFDDSDLEPSDIKSTQICSIAGKFIDNIGIIVTSISTSITTTTPVGII